MEGYIFCEYDGPPLNGTESNAQYYERTTNLELYDKLRRDILNNDVVIKGMKQGGYSIQYEEKYKHRILRVQELKYKSKYKCTCDSEKSRGIFDKIKNDYADREGFEYKVMVK